MSTSVIQLNTVSISQSTGVVITNLSLNVNKGEFVYLLGKTGSGKSSVLKCLYAEVGVKSGTAVVAGHELSKITSKEIPFLRRKLGIVFQDFQLLTDRSIYENLRFVMRATGWTDKKLIADKALDVLEKVGLRSKLKKMPHELSGGEQQRVVIARALLNDPEIILADEPTGNLDPETSEKIVLLLKQISQSGTAVLIATHDYHIIRTFPSRIIKCENGKVLEDVQIA